MAASIRKQSPSDNPHYRDCADDELDFRLAGLAASHPEVTLDRLNRRQSLREQLAEQRRELERSPGVRSFQARQEQAWRLLMSADVADALDVRRERPALRDTYGRNLFGQSLLMGRRLVQAGARFVTVAWDMAVRGDSKTSWDSHEDLTRVMRDHLLPGLDRGLSALLDDMSQSGLLDETLVFVAGEMGRTPSSRTAAPRTVGITGPIAFLACLRALAFLAGHFTVNRIGMPPIHSTGPFHPLTSRPPFPIAGD